MISRSARFWVVAGALVKQDHPLCVLHGLREDVDRDADPRLVRQRLERQHQHLAVDQGGEPQLLHRRHELAGGDQLARALAHPHKAFMESGAPDPGGVDHRLIGDHEVARPDRSHGDLRGADDVAPHARRRADIRGEAQAADAAAHRLGQGMAGGGAGVIGLRIGGDHTTGCEGHGDRSMICIDRLLGDGRLQPVEERADRVAIGAARDQRQPAPLGPPQGRPRRQHRSQQPLDRTDDRVAHRLAEQRLQRPEIVDPKKEQRVLRRLIPCALPVSAQDALVVHADLRAPSQESSMLESG